MIRGVVFDLDHTLFDRYGTLRKVLPNFFAFFRKNIPVELTVESFIAQFITLEKKYVHLGWKRLLQACVEDGIFLSYSDIFYNEAVDYIFQAFGEVSVPYPFTATVLTALRSNGFKVGIITNGSSALQSKKIQMLGLDGLVDEILITGDIGVHKPKPEPFLLMSERLGIPPLELLYVGDNPKNDVEGSRNAGYIPVWVKTTGYWCFEEIPRAEYEVETVEEIPALVSHINQKCFALN